MAETCRWIWSEPRDSSLLQNVKTGWGSHPTSYSIGASQSMQVTAHFHLVPRLRMSGAIPLLSLYAFMAHRGMTSPSCPYIPGIYILVWWAGITCIVLLFRLTHNKRHSQYLDCTPFFKGLLVVLMLQHCPAFWVVERVHIVSFLCVNVEINFYHSFIHTYILTYIHTYTHTHIHTYIHSYIHTYVRTYVMEHAV